MNFKNKTVAFLPFIILTLTVVVLIVFIEVPKIFSKSKSKNSLAGALLVNKIVSPQEKSLKDNDLSDTTDKDSSGDQIDQKTSSDTSNADSKKSQDSSSDSNLSNSTDKQDSTKRQLKLKILTWTKLKQ